MRISMRYLTILILATGCAGIASASERTPPGSYLPYRVTTVGQLRAQVDSNPVVQSRYTRHFSTSPAELDRLLESNLKLVALKEPLKTKCWYIDKTGRVSAKTKLLPRGSMVFATKSGEPLLEWSCGNPLRAELPKVITKTKSSVETLAPQKVETKVLANPIETISTAVITAPPAPAVVSVLPVTTPPVLATIAAPAVSMPPILGAASSFGAGWLGVLGAAGGIAAGLSGGGGGNHVIPEPTSFVVLGSALFAMTGIWKIRRRRS